MGEAEHADVPNEGKPDGAGTPAKHSGVRRWLHILGAVVVAVVLPVAVAGIVAGELGAQAVFLGVVLGGTGAKLGGTRRMLYLAPAVGGAAALGAHTAYDWWWVGLLAVSGAVVGAGTGFGWFPPLLVLAFAATFAVPVPSGTGALIAGTTAALGAGYGIVIARRFGAAPVVEGERLPAVVATVVALVFGVVLAAGAALGVALDWTEPYWVPEPILILVLYIVMGKRDRIKGKAIGTAFGSALALPVAVLAPSAWVTSAIATVAFIVALTQADRYWLMYGLYTFALVLALAAPGQVAVEAEQRGFEILAGVAILVVGLAVVHAIGDRLLRRSPRPELVP